MSEPISPEVLATLLGRWADGRGPLYCLLDGRLRALIEEESLPQGTVLPPERRLSHLLSVGRGTVAAAYERLRQQGYVERRQGSGTRVAHRALPVAGPPRESPNGLKLLALLERPTDTDSVVLTCAAQDTPPPELAEAYQYAVQNLAGLRNDIGYYPVGLAELRARIAEHYTRRGLPTEPAQVLVTSGAHQAIDLVVRGYVAAGDAILTEAPTYPGALALFGAAAADVHAIGVSAGGLDVGELTAEMARVRPALTYLIPSFQNPTGTLVPALHRRRIASAAAEHGLLVIDDETMAQLGFEGDPPPPVAAFPGGENVVTVGSLSKLAWGGLRLGWVRAERTVIARLARLKTLGDLGNEAVAQLAAAELLRAPEALIERRRAELARGYERLAAGLHQALPGWEWQPPLGGQTLWARLPSGDAASFAQLALRHGVALLPGDALKPGNCPSQWLRIPFLADGQTLDTAVTRIKAAWEGYTLTGRHETPALRAMVV